MTVSVLNMFEIGSVVGSKQLPRQSIVFLFASEFKDIGVVSDEFQSWALKNEIEVFEVIKIEKVAVAITKDTISQHFEIKDMFENQESKEGE